MPRELEMLATKETPVLARHYHELIFRLWFFIILFFLLFLQNNLSYGHEF